MSNVTSTIELYDSEILAIDRGPLAWAAEKQGTTMNVDGFVRGLVSKFEDVGLKARVNTYDTTESGTYAFEIVIFDRFEKRPFDHDRMVHEVQSGMLLGEASGTIKADLSILGDAAPHKH